MGIQKNMDSIEYHQKIAVSKTKLFYSGERYLPVLEHPAYGQFFFDEKESSFTLPTPYAQILLDASPNLFSKEQTKGLELQDMEYKDLLKLAEEKGYDTAENSRKKADLVKFLENV